MLMVRDGVAQAPGAGETFTRSPFAATPSRYTAIASSIYPAWSARSSADSSPPRWAGRWPADRGFNCNAAALVEPGSCGAVHAPRASRRHSSRRPLIACIPAGSLAGLLGRRVVLRSASGRAVAAFSDCHAPTDPPEPHGAAGQLGPFELSVLDELAQGRGHRRAGDPGGGCDLTGRGARTLLDGRPDPTQVLPARRPRGCPPGRLTRPGLRPASATWLPVCPGAQCVEGRLQPPALLVSATRLVLPITDLTQDASK